MNKHRQRVKTRHIILGVMCLMYFISYIDRVNIAVAGPLIRQEMGLTSVQLGLVFSAFAYPYAVMQIVGGWLADRFGPKLVLTVLSLIWGAATLATGFAGSIGMLVLLRSRAGHRRGRRVSDRDARLHVLDAGARARLRARHHA